MQPRKRTQDHATKMRSALLLIDFMNPLDFDGARALAPRAVKAAARAAELKKQMRAHLRKYELRIPGDCVASENDAWRRDALAYMARVMKANVDPVGA